MNFSTYLKQTHDEIKQHLHDIEALPLDESIKRQECFKKLKGRLLNEDKLEERLMHDNEEFYDARKMVKKLASCSLEPQLWQEKFEELKQVVDNLLLQTSQQCVVSFKWH